MWTFRILSSLKGSNICESGTLEEELLMLTRLFTTLWLNKSTNARPLWWRLNMKLCWLWLHTPPPPRIFVLPGHQHCFSISTVMKWRWYFDIAVHAYLSVLFSDEGNPNLMLVSKRSLRTEGVSGVEGVQQTAVQPTYGTFSGSSTCPVHYIQ